MRKCLQTRWRRSARRTLPVVGPLGLVLPTFPQRRPDLPSAGQLASLCRAAESAGASGLWACDHLYWHGPTLECLAAVTVAAVSTEVAMVGSCVLQLPLRQPAVVAKQASSLAHLGGRMVLGVGVGTHEAEYAATGVEFKGRGRHLDEAIDAMRTAWEPTDTAEADAYRQLPVPVSVPIWVGGSSEAALRRAAAKADGWIPLFLGPDDYEAALARLDKETDRSGRDRGDVARALVVFVSAGGADATDRGLHWMADLYRLPPRSFARHLVSGDTRTCARALERYLEAGAAHIAVFVTDDDPLVQFEDVTGELNGLCLDAGRPVGGPR